MGEIHFRLVGKIPLTPSPFNFNLMHGRTVGREVFLAECRKMRFSEFDFLKGREDFGTQRRITKTHR